MCGTTGSAASGHDPHRNWQKFRHLGDVQYRSNPVGDAPNRVGVNGHDRVILVCSKSSLQRPGVLNELEETLQREARDGGNAYLIPVRLDDFVIDGPALRTDPRALTSPVALGVQVDDLGGATALAVAPASSQFRDTGEGQVAVPVSARPQERFPERGLDSSIRWIQNLDPERARRAHSWSLLLRFLEKSSRPVPSCPKISPSNPVGTLKSPRSR